MTPEQLRERAKKHLADARVLLDASPENASYLSGYAMEFVLKARLCTKRGWSRLPDSFAEFCEWCERDGLNVKDRIFVHNLDELLRLSDTDYLKHSSFIQIDWKRACSWSEQERYLPIGSLSVPEVRGRVDEIEKAIDLLLTYEMVEGLLKIEIEISKKFGPFNCFSVNQASDGSGWVLVCAWRSVSEEHHQNRKQALQEAVDIDLDPSLSALIVDKCWESPDAPVIQGAMALAGFVGGILHSPMSRLSDNLVGDYPQMTSGYYITVGNWSKESLVEDWRKIGVISSGNEI